MHIVVDRLGTVASLQQALGEACAAPGVRSLFILACDANSYPADAMDALLRNQRMPVFGGVFPAVLHGMEKLSLGCVVLGLTHEVVPHVIHGLSDPAADYLARLERSLDNSPPGRTMLVLVDGLARRLASFIEALFCLHGLEVNYLGGGAGSLSFVQQPCIITNAGLVADAGLVVALDTPSGVALGHGWEPLREGGRSRGCPSGCSGLCATPFMATKTNHNAIVSLDWQPALDIYASIVQCHSGQNPADENFFDVAKSYPFGMARPDSHLVVRAPLYLDGESSLVCIGEVPVGTFLEVLHGDKRSLIEAAGQAHREARGQLPLPAEPALCLVMDCISRLLFLGADYARELESQYSRHIPMVGACTIGEIANNGKRTLNLYNNTCAVGYLEQP